MKIETEKSPTHVIEASPSPLSIDVTDNMSKNSLGKKEFNWLTSHIYPLGKPRQDSRKKSYRMDMRPRAWRSTVY